MKHKDLGKGTITKFDGNYLTVSFESKVSMFQYPKAFTNYLQAMDPSIQASILCEIESAKAAEVALPKVAESAILAEAEMHSSGAVAEKSSVKKNTTKVETMPNHERIINKRMTYFVFQNSTFHRELQGGYLWAPITNKSGNTFHHWDRLLDVHPGDIILHGYNGHIQAVSIARSACYDCVQPKELRTEDSWDLEGRRIDSEYILLQHSIKTLDYVDDIIRLCNKKYSPFNKHGTGNQGYLFEINRQMAKIFLGASIAANPYLKGNSIIADLLAE